uniref:Uncharacterized protein n=1 Tax=Arundo donax TaxID=35708 RepID=A0A0A9AW28_ARUDO
MHTQIHKEPCCPLLPPPPMAGYI